jgi:hypothetical protein
MSDDRYQKNQKHYHENTKERKHEKEYLSPVPQGGTRAAETPETKDRYQYGELVAKAMRRGPYAKIKRAHLSITASPHLSQSLRIESPVWRDALAITSLRLSEKREVTEKMKSRSRLRPFG